MIKKVELILASEKFYYFAVVWFLLQAVFFAFTISEGVPPDENYHFSYIIYLADNGLNPFIEQVNNFELGDLERQVSYLYHLLLAVLYKILPFSEETTFYLLRLLNVGFGLSSLVVLKKLGTQLDISNQVANFAIFVLGSTLMFTFLSASINYDNLVVLISVLSFYVFVLITKKFTLTRLLSLACLVLAGSLVKYTYLPLAVFFSTLGAYQAYRNKEQLTASLKNTIKYSNFKNFLLIFLCIFLFVLVAERIGTNLYKYDSINPRCDAVHAIEDCESQALFRRNMMMLETKSSQLSLMNLREFIPSWVEVNTVRTFGIFAHERFKQPFYTLVPIVLFLSIALVATIRAFSFKKDKILSLLYLIGAAYMGVLLYVNYDLYQTYGRFGLALQGRYSFLVLPIIYLVSFHYFKEEFPRVFSILLIPVIVVFMIASAPILFLSSGNEWLELPVNSFNLINLAGEQ